MDIPEDVVTLILVRLPVKSLLRFRCVCKAWRGLIGSRRFIDMHLRHPSQGRENEYLVVKRFETRDENSMMSFYRRDGEALRKAAPDLKEFPPGKMFVSGACNGICLVVADFDQYDWEDMPLYLCNPATRELRKIPNRPFGRQRARESTVGMYGAPFACARVGLGFGYDSRTNDYKVVSIMSFIDDIYFGGDPPHGPLKIEIYHLSSNSWRVADTIFPKVDLLAHNIESYPGLDPQKFSNELDFYDYDQIFQIRHFSCGLFFNGSIHWNALDHKSILALNMSDEVMQAIQLPHAISVMHNSWANALFVLEDSLAFVERDYLGYQCQEIHWFNVWVMMKYGDVESWIKRFYLEPEMHMDVLAFWNDVLICETIDGELASCNLQEDAPRFRKHENDFFRESGMGAIVMHKESLVRLRF